MGLFGRLDSALELWIVLGHLAHISVALDRKLRRASQSALNISSEYPWIVGKLTGLNSIQTLATGFDVHKNIICRIDNRLTVFGDCRIPPFIRIVSTRLASVSIGCSTLLRLRLTFHLVKLHQLAPAVHMLASNRRNFIKVVSLAGTDAPFQPEQGGLDLLFIGFKLCPRCLAHFLTLQNDFLQGYQIGAEFRSEICMDDIYARFRLTCRKACCQMISLLFCISNNTPITAGERDFLPTLRCLYGILPAPFGLRQTASSAPLGVVPSLCRLARPDVLGPPFTAHRPHLIAGKGGRTGELATISHLHRYSLRPGLLSHGGTPLPKHLRGRLDPITRFRSHGNDRVRMDMWPLAPLPFCLRIIGRIMHGKHIA
ncbi:MAG: hypothetical protein EOR89_33425, partial [Mesorhizobium sp.]